MKKVLIIILITLSTAAPAINRKNCSVHNDRNNVPRNRYIFLCRNDNNPRRNTITEHIKLKEHKETNKIASHTKRSSQVTKVHDSGNPSYPKNPDMKANY